MGAQMVAWAVLLAGLAGGQVGEAPARPPADEPTMRDLLRGKALVVPGIAEELGRDVYGQPWHLAGRGRGNFTAFPAGVRGLAPTPDGGLRFTMTGPKAVLRWGNCDGKQPLAQRKHLWPWSNTVELRLRQDAARSAWAVRFFSDGQAVRRRGLTAVKAELVGRDFRTLRFNTAQSAFQGLGGVVCDGFEVEVQAPKGTAVEIASLRITRRRHEGYFRKEFDLPDEPIWRAVGDVGIGTYLYVNGREVDVESATFRRPRLDGPAASKTYRGHHGGLVPVDLAPHLRPGRNCIGLYGRQINRSPIVYLQGQVVTVSGRTARIDSDETWRLAPKAPAGWCKVGFDDRGWKHPQASTGPLLGYVVSGYLVGSGGAWMGPNLPVHDGRLVIENPHDRMLFYEDAKAVVVRVRVPPGLASRKPEIDWRLTRAEPAGERQLARGRAKTFRRDGSSLVCDLDLGRLARGVYAIGLSLRTGGKRIERRPREPLVVLGRLAMKEIDGESYEDGLELTLDETIDFTKADDPHAWVETTGATARPDEPTPAVTKPRIVRRVGLVYRETAPLQRHQYGRGAPMFSYRFRFKEPDSFYLMVLEYPDDAERWIGVSCSTTFRDVWTNSRAGPSVWTGGKWPLTGAMQELRWIHRSGPGEHTLDVLPLQIGATAAARRLRIYRIKELPALRVRAAPDGRRLLGTYTERTAPYTGFWRTFGPARAVPHIVRLPAGSQDFQPIPERLRYLREALDACQAYTRYLRFTGQNLHAMGCFQYGDHNTPFAAGRGASPRVPRDLRQMAVRVFGLNGIDVIGVISYNAHRCLGEEYPFNDGQVAAGRDTAVLVSRDGRQPPARGGGRGYGAGWNPLHGRVRGLMVQTARAAAQAFADRPNFRGVNWTTYLTGEWAPGFGGMRWSEPLLHSYDDATIARFEKDTSVRVPGQAREAGRFRKRHDFLTRDGMREKWVAWRCEKIRDLYRDLRGAVRSARDDLDLLAALYVDVPHTRKWAQSGMPLRTFLREWGHDPAMLAGELHLRPVRWMHAILHGEPARRKEHYAAGWLQNSDRQFIDLYARPPAPAVMIMHQWIEINYRPPGVVGQAGSWRFAGKPSWPTAGNRGRLLVQPSGPNARETFVQALAGSDPHVLMYGFLDVNMMVGQEQRLRRFARVFRSLPARPLEPALGTNLKTNLAIRHGREGRDYYLSVCNPGCWPVRGSVTVAGARAALDLPTGRPVPLTPAGKGARLPVALEPYDAAAFRVTGENPHAVAWRNEPVDAKHLAHLRGLLARCERLLAAKGAAAPTPEDRRLLAKSHASAAADLKAGRLAAAWQTLTHWRLWHLVRNRAATKAAQ